VAEYLRAASDGRALRVAVGGGDGPAPPSRSGLPPQATPAFAKACAALLQKSTPV
jgi:hypothetical protein